MKKVLPGIALLILAVAGRASAGTMFGALSNFDAVNDTGSPCNGFEIELDDIQSTRRHVHLPVSALRRPEDHRGHLPGEWRVAPANVRALDEPVRSGQSRLHADHPGCAVGFQGYGRPPVLQEHDRQRPALRYGRVRALRGRHAQESIQHGVPLDEGRPDDSGQPDRPGESGHHSGSGLDSQPQVGGASGGRRGHPGSATAGSRSGPLSARTRSSVSPCGRRSSKRNRRAKPIWITSCPTMLPFPATSARCQTRTP